MGGLTPVGSTLPGVGLNNTGNFNGGNGEQSSLSDVTAYAAILSRM